MLSCRRLFNGPGTIISVYGYILKTFYCIRDMCLYIWEQVTFFIQPEQETPVMGTDNQDYDYDIDD